MAFAQDMLDLEFSGVAALVAGGEHGLGVAIAKGFAEKGARVYIAGDLVENSAQTWELSSVYPGSCSVLPKKMFTADEMLAEVAEREDTIHILIDDATAGWGLVFARAEAFYEMLLNGSVGASDPAHIITITSSAQPACPWDGKAANAESARALTAEFSDDSVVVNCIEPARNEVTHKDVADMAIFLCTHPSVSTIDGKFGLDKTVVSAVSVAQSSDQFPFLQARL